MVKFLNIAADLARLVSILTEQKNVFILYLFCCLKVAQVVSVIAFCVSFIADVFMAVQDLTVLLVIFIVVSVILKVNTLLLLLYNLLFPSHDTLNSHNTLD